MSSSLMAVNKHFKEFAALTVSMDKALAYFDCHPDTVLGLFGRYQEDSGLELNQDESELKPAA